MTVKVLVVDDSSFFRRRVSEILNADPFIEVVDTAVNGQEAVAKAKSVRPDVITMDVEMPVLNGIEAVKQIMAATPTPILMFSSLTREGARSTLDALDAGALDFLPKKFEDIARSSEQAIETLQKKVKEIARRRVLVSSRQHVSSTATTRPSLRTSVADKATPVPASQPKANFKASGKKYQLLAIGTSTGGPVALQKILMQLPADFDLPILLIQHMPAAFTGAFAQRLNNLCKIEVKEAQNGERLKPGVAYLAPGGQQMIFDARQSKGTLRVFVDDDARISYKPSVDLTFASAAKQYGADVLAVVLTGMGADGRDGARMLKQKGATIWAQDEASSVVYGMPAAIANAQLHSQQLALEQMAPAIIKEVQGG